MASSSRISRLSLLLLLSASQVLPAAAATFKQCYYPDGSIPTDALWAPCSGEGHSGCCDVYSGDICQPNGLCFWSSSSANNTYRGTCTDRTWNDPACPNICTKGFEDEWIWTTPCSSKADGSDLNYACGFRDSDSNRRTAANCTASATKYTKSFVTSKTTSTKATRYTPPVSPDTSLFSVFVETYTTKVTIMDYATTLTTTWESTVTSAIGQPSGKLPSGTSASKNSITGTQGGLTGLPSSSSSSAPQTSEAASTGTSPAVLGGAVGGGVVVIALLAGLFFFLRKRSAKKSSSERIDSPPPPPNGPVGINQVTPYEVGNNEAFAPPGPAGSGDKKYVYVAPGAYEMSSAGEKGWPVAAEVSGDHRPGAYEMGSHHPQEKRYPAEVSGDARPQWGAGPGQPGVSPGGVISPMSPAPAYSGLNPAYAGAVEMDGSDYAPSRPTTSSGNARGRNGVGNA